MVPELIQSQDATKKSLRTSASPNRLTCIKVLKNTLRNLRVVKFRLKKTINSAKLQDCIICSAVTMPKYSRTNSNVKKFKFALSTPSKRCIQILKSFKVRCYPKTVNLTIKRSNS